MEIFIYISSGKTYIVGLVADIIKELQQQYPNIKIHIISGDADEITERIKKGLLNFVVLIEPVNLMKYESFLFPAQDT